jgi:hypothetical protein
MEKLCLLLVSCALWIVPAPFVAAAEEAKGGVLANSVTKWPTFEINGILDFDDGGLRPRIPEFGVWLGYGITVDGKWFGLDLGGDKERDELAKKLIGKRVLVRGTVEERTLDGFIKRQIKVVVVSELEAVNLGDSITVQLTGVFHESAPITYLHQMPTISVNGQTYVIDYEGAEGIFQAARKMDGKRVVLTGKLTGTTSFPVLCRCEPMKLATVFLTGIKVADEKATDDALFTIRGKLKRLPVLPTDAEPFPTWTISASSRDFFVVFANDKLEKLAEKSDGKVVVLSGALGTQECVDVNALGDPVIKTTVDVVRVMELSAVELDSVHETVNLQIVGELRLEVLQSEPPIYLWSITVEDKTYVLQFSPDVPKEKPGSLEGRRVVATGRLLDNGKVLVTGIRLATDR